MTTATTASNPRPSTCLDIAGAVDLDVTVYLADDAGGLEYVVSHSDDDELEHDDLVAAFRGLYGRPPEADDGDDSDLWSLCCAAVRTLTGEVTLAPRQHDGQLAPYGPSPDHWISGALLAQLRELDDEDFRVACREIADAAAAVATSIT